MRQRSSIRSIVCLEFFWGLFVVVTVMPAQTANAGKPVYFRVPFAVDLGRSEPSSMLLELPQQPWDLTVSELQAIKATPREHAVWDLFNTLLAGDASGLVARSRPPETVSPEDAQALSQALVGALGRTGARDLQLLGEYPFPEGPTILGWRPVAATTDRNYYFYLDWSPTTQQLHWIPGELNQPHRSLSALIAESERAARRGDAVVVPFEPDAYRFTVPIEHSGARLHFNGKSYRWNVAREAPPPGELLAYYKTAYDALYNEGMGAFGEYFSPQSRRKIEDWYATFEEGQEALYRRDLKRQNRLLVFVLNADPFFVFYYNTFNAGPGYDTLYRNPQTGEVYLTGFQMIANVDVMLRDREFFWRDVVSPLASRGAEPDLQSSMPVAPAYLASASGPTGPLLASSGTAAAVGQAPSSLPASDDGAPRPSSPAQADTNEEGFSQWLAAIVVLGVIGAAVALMIRQRRRHE